jgi:AraC-like DNA-binding protein
VQQVTEMFQLIHRENVQERSLSVPLLNLLLSDLRNTLFKARFQVSPAQTAENQAALTQLDDALQQTPTFPLLERNALTLCSLFTRTQSPSDPIPEIERYLQENFTDPSLCLSKLSDRYHISESYLSHLFKDRTGENFSTYLENLRMDEAQKRLAQGGCSLSTLYAELGYTNPTTWRRAFKKRFGMTPSEMIAQNK